MAPGGAGASTQLDSRELPFGGEFAWRFDQPGTHEYWCDLHSPMTGQVIVE